MGFEAETKVRMAQKTLAALAKLARKQADLKGNRVTISDVIRDAIHEYLQQKATAKKPLKPLLAIVTTDTFGLITSINQEFTDMCGYSFAELVGKKPGAVLQGPETEREVVDGLREAIRAERPHSCTLTNYHRDGSTYRVQIDMEPLKVKNKLTGFRAVERRLS